MSSRSRKPFCNPCMKKGIRRHPTAIKTVGQGTLLRCYCGHEYISYSKTAMQLGRMLNNKK